MAEFIQSLKDAAYSDLSIEGHSVDLQGWINTGFDEVFKHCLQTEDPLVIEVGTWKGASADRMMKMMEKKGNVICVDTWLGAPEFWVKNYDLKRIKGYPSVFYTFTKNMKALGYENHIAPLPLSSIQAADLLDHHGVKADIIYIDAAHEYDAVKQDILAYHKLLKPGGIMMGDDFHWPGVEKAVKEVLPAYKLNGVVWYG